MGHPRFALAGLALTVAGCGGEALVQGEMSDLRRRLESSERRAADAERKVAELEDRVFLLTDQVESQKVAVGRTPQPRLPVVMLKPPAADDRGGSDEAGEIEYQGEARSPHPSRVRPSLRLSEASPPPTRRVPSPPSSGGATSDDLGVAPAPPVRAALDRTPEHLTSAVEREPLPDDPLRLYRTAYDDLRAGRNAEAERGFREFVRRFPHHDYADNAQYWLGETFYGRKRFAEASAEFRTVVARYPLGNKAPDALLKLAFCLLALGDGEKGREVLAQVGSSYPRTEAARLAAERLAELGQKEGTKS